MSGTGILVLTCQNVRHRRSGGVPLNGLIIRCSLKSSWRLKRLYAIIWADLTFGTMSREYSPSEAIRRTLAGDRRGGP